MTTSLLKHSGRCGGAVFLDVSGLFILRTPSIAFSPTGIKIGVIEPQVNYGGEKPKLSCSKCGKDVPVDVVEIECLICHKPHLAEDTFSSREIPALCRDCKDCIQGKETPDVSIAKVIGYLSLPKEFQMASFAEILKMKITV